VLKGISRNSLPIPTYLDSFPLKTPMVWDDENAASSAEGTTAAKSWLSRCQDTMAAAAFAEKGDVKTATEILYDPDAH
jgi:hypothetical protein